MHFDISKKTEGAILMQSVEIRVSHTFFILRRHMSFIRNTIVEKCIAKYSTIGRTYDDVLTSISCFQMETTILLLQRKLQATRFFVIIGAFYAAVFRTTSQAAVIACVKCSCSCALIAKMHVNFIVAR